MQGTVGGHPFLLSYVVGDVNHPDQGLNEPAAIVGHDTLNWADALTYDARGVTVNPNRTSAAINADLKDTHGAVVAHVQGTFSCATV